MIYQVSMHILVFICRGNMKYINQWLVKHTSPTSSLTLWYLEAVCCCSSLGEGFGRLLHQLIVDWLPH